MTLHPWHWQQQHPTHSHSHSHSHWTGKYILQGHADCTLHLQGFSYTHQILAGEFRDLNGLLAISKASLFNTNHYCDTKRPLTHRYGLKRDRRKLQIKMLHLPPEEFSSTNLSGGSVCGGGARSGGGRLSSSNNATTNATTTTTSSSKGSSGCGNGGGHSKLDF